MIWYVICILTLIAGNFLYPYVPSDWQPIFASLVGAAAMLEFWYAKETKN